MVATCDAIPYCHRPDIYRALVLQQAYGRSCQDQGQWDYPSLKAPGNNGYLSKYHLLPLRKPLKQLRSNWHGIGSSAGGIRKGKYLLRGLLACANCGFKLAARTTEGRAYYCCSSKSHNNRPKICSAKNIRGDSLEAAVWDSVSRLLSRPELIMEQVKNRSQANPSAYLEANLDRLSHVLGRKKVEADRMLDAYKIRSDRPSDSKAKDG